MAYNYFKHLEHRNTYQRYADEYRALIGLSRNQPLDQIADRSRKNLEGILASGNRHFMQIVDVYLYTKISEMIDKGIIGE